MLIIIAFESTDRFSSAHTGVMLGRFLRWLSIRPTPDTLQTVNAVLRKCGHVLGYGILSFLLFRACRGTYRALAGYYSWRTSRLNGIPLREAFHFLWQFSWALLALCGTALAAITDEVHQMGIPSRTGSWWDVLLDSSAAFASQVLIFVFAVRKTRCAQEALIEKCNGRH